MFVLTFVPVPDYTDDLKNELMKAVSNLDSNFIAHNAPTGDPIFNTPE